MIMKRAALMCVLLLLLAACAVPAPRAAAPDPLATATLEAPEPQMPIIATPASLGRHPIYVLDPQGGELISRIWVIDPQTQKVVRSFAARYTPDLAFSSDGRRLYVADSYSTQVIRGEWRDVLSVYDPFTGDLLREEVAVPDRLKYKLLPHGRRYLLVSPDGRRLFVRKYGDPDVHQLRLSVLDSKTFEVLAE